MVKRRAHWTIHEAAAAILGLDPEPHHMLLLDEITALIEGTVPWRKLLVIMPPGFAKSTYVSMVLPAWYLGEHPDHNLLFLTSSDTQAHQFNTVLKSVLENSAPFKALYGREPHSPDRDRGWSHDGLYLAGTPLTSKDPAFRAVGYEASVIGARVHGIIMDDPLTQEASRSLKEQATARSYHDGTLDSRLHPTVGWEVAIMTRWDEKDLAGHLMAKNGWHTVVLPALLPRWAKERLDEPFLSFPLPADSARRRQEYQGIFSSSGTLLLDAPAGNSGAGPLAPTPETTCSALPDAPTGEDLMQPSADEEEVSLWPGRFPTPFLKDKRDDDPALFGCLYQGDPTIYGGDVFKMEWLRQPLPSPLPRPLLIYQFWDTAFSEKTSADFSVCMTIGVDRDRNVYILHVLRKRLSPLALLSAIPSMAGAFKPVLVGIEEAAYRQQAIRDIVRQVQVSSFVPIRAIKPTQDKRARAMLPAGRAEAGKVFLPQNASWTYEFLREVVAFDHGAHDDQVDAFSGVVQLAAESHSATGFQDAKYAIGTPTKKERPWYETNSDEPIFVNLEGRPVTLGKA